MATGKERQKTADAISPAPVPEMEGSARSAGQDPEERRRRIAEAAYYRAERRGFAPGQEEADWLESEREIVPFGESEGGIDALDQCLRSELSAIETYEQALEKNRREYGTDPKFQVLTRVLHEHREAAARLRAFIEQGGGTPSDDAGAWGAWSKLVMAAAKLFGDKAALKALKEGEESGLKAYRAAQEAALPAEVRNATSQLMAQQQAHIRQLDLLIDSA